MPETWNDEQILHILWMNGGLSCDGDSIAMAEATQPSIEEIMLGALPRLPKVGMHLQWVDCHTGPVHAVPDGGAGADDPVGRGAAAAVVVRGDRAQRM